MPKALIEKDPKLANQWVGVAAEIARVWGKEGMLKPVYMVDALGKGRELVCN